ncbi:MAG: amidohydrolase family protein [Rhodanobacter sp.]
MTTPTSPTIGKADYRRIAAEEACCPPEMLGIYRKLIEEKRVDDPGFNTMMGFYLSSSSERAQIISNQLSDLGAQRLAHMDAAGIDHAILALTSPGVQVMEKAEGTAFATYANDWLAEGIAKHPTRYSGLAACAPQDPAAAAKEIQRGVTKLGLKGVIINSHTAGEYLDDRKFWPIFEAAEALDVPIYLHPNTPSKEMIGPFLERGLDGAIFGFSVETGLHMLRIITAGVFDRFPKLQMVLGHTGEALPFWLYRLDYMHRAGVVSNRYDTMKALDRKVSDYLRENVNYTNSGVAWEPAIKFIQDVIGVDRMMYAMDYPYQYQPGEVAILDQMNMSDADKKKFFQTNAERLFKL